MSALFRRIHLGVTHLGGLTLTAARTLKALGRADGDEFLRALASFGVASLPVMLATALFTGVIMVLQAATYVRQFGIYNLVGWFAGFATFREVGPILIGLMFSGRVGAANTSELGTMKAHEHFDALRMMALDPFAVLISPRLLAMTLAMVCLVILSDVVAVFSGLLCAWLLLNIEFGAFMGSLLEGVAPWDFLLGVMKGGIFGALIAIISSDFGMRRVPSGGASGEIGRAVFGQVVLCAVALFVCDALMALIWSS